MELDADTTASIANRLKRARGQLDGVIRMLDEGRECEDIVTQLAAVNRALDRAGFQAVAGGLKACIRAEGDVDTAKLEKLFLSLA